MNGTTDLNFARDSKIHESAWLHLFSILKVVFILFTAVALLIAVSAS